MSRNLHFRTANSEHLALPRNYEFPIVPSEHRSSLITMSGGPVYRMTLFKVPDPEDQKKLLAIYTEMPIKAVKVCAE